MTYPGGPDDGRNQDPYGGGQHGDQNGIGYGGGQYGAPMPGAPMPDASMPGEPTGGPFATGTAGSLSPTEAVASGWRLFTGNPGPWIVMALLTYVCNIVYSIATNSMEPTSPALAGISLVYYVAAIAIQACIYRGALLEVDGYQPTIGDLFKLTNFGRFFLVGLAISAIVAVTMGVPFVFGLQKSIAEQNFEGLLIGTSVGVVLTVVIVFFLMWGLAFAMDRGSNVFAALGASFRVTKENLASLVGLAVLNVLIMILGTLLVGLGLLVALPVTTLASVWAYRYLTGPSGFSQREAEKAAAAGGTHA